MKAFCQKSYVWAIKTPPTIQLVLVQASLEISLVLQLAIVVRSINIQSPGSKMILVQQVYGNIDS